MAPSTGLVASAMLRILLGVLVNHSGRVRLTGGQPPTLGVWAIRTPAESVPSRARSCRREGPGGRAHVGVAAGVRGVRVGGAHRRDRALPAGPRRPSDCGDG